MSAGRIRCRCRSRSWATPNSSRKSCRWSRPLSLARPPRLWRCLRKRNRGNPMWKKALLWIAVPALLCAQGSRRGGGFPGGFGMQWWDNPVAGDLNLTDAQNTQIRGVVREYRTRLIDLRAAEEKAQGELQDVFNDA